MGMVEDSTSQKLSKIIVNDLSNSTVLYYCYSYICGEPLFYPPSPPCGRLKFKTNIIHYNDIDKDLF